MWLKSTTRQKLQEVKDWEKLNFCLGFCSIHLGILSERAAGINCRSFVIRLEGRAPKRPGEKFSVYTLGLKIISYGKRIRLGLIRRKQVLVKV